MSFSLSRDSDPNLWPLSRTQMSRASSTHKHHLKLLKSLLCWLQQCLASLDTHQTLDENRLSHVNLSCICCQWSKSWSFELNSVALFVPSTSLRSSLLAVGCSIVPWCSDSSDRQWFFSLVEQRVSMLKQHKMRQWRWIGNRHAHTALILPNCFFLATHALWWLNNNQLSTWSQHRFLQGAWTKTVTN